MQNKILSVSNTFNYWTIDSFILWFLPMTYKEKMNQFKVIEYMTCLKIMFKGTNWGNYSNIKHLG